MHAEPGRAWYGPVTVLGPQPVGIAFLGNELPSPFFAYGVALDFDVDFFCTGACAPAKPEKARDAIDGRTRIIQQILV